MPSYLLTYDLNNERGSADYRPLYDELERLGGQRALYSVWLIAMNGSAGQVHDHFRQFLDGNDLIFVTKLRKNAAPRAEYSYSARAGTNDWLKRNTPQ